MKVSTLLCSSLLLVIAITVSVLSFNSSTMFAQATVPAPGDLTGAAWSSNIGWIDLGNRTGVSYGVKAATTGTTRNLSGYGWSSNIGWVSFNGSETGGCPISLCQPRIEWGAGGPAVKFLGFARACSVFVSGCAGGLKDESERGGWDGFISLGDSNPTDAVRYGATLNTTSGVAAGYAWGSEVVGWLNFAGVKLIVPIVPDPECPGGGTPPCDGNPPVTCPGGGTPPCDGNPPVTCPGGGTPPCISGDPNDGICKNIPIAIQSSLNITTTSLPPNYRQTTDGNCLCTAGYILNAQFKCVKPIYTER